jgi:4'-phosphopantetheinyl transferase
LVVSGLVVNGPVVNGPVAIDVTLVSLRVSTSTIGHAVALLDEREHAAASMRVGDARRRYLVAHAAARVVIGERLDADPARVIVTSEAGGRPVVDGVAFSLSHSGEQAAVAIAAAGARIGVDLEWVRPRPHLDRLAQRVFDPDEYETWRGLPPRARPRAFAARWTEVEAVLKARGTGIAGGLASAIALPPGWSCAAIDAGSGYVGAVAAQGPAMSVTSRVLRLADALTRRGGTAR